MARHGENIRKREDGRWEARYQIFDAAKGRKIYRSVYGSTYEEAKEKRAAIQTAGMKSGYGKNTAQGDGKNRCTQILFSQAASEWLEEISDKRRHSTYIKYENIYKSHLEEFSGSCLLSDTPNQELQKRISDHLSQKGMSESIRKSIVCIANQILAFANKKYSVCVPLLKQTGTKSAKKTAQTFSKAEQSRLFACVNGSKDCFKLAILLSLYTGMRLGELCALKWTDFDFQDMTVTVSRTVQRIAVEGHATKTILMETDPKSECSQRMIPLPADLVHLLKEFHGQQPYVFGRGRPFEPRTMQYQFQRILKEAGIDNRNFHSLRHTFATNCVESGMDVKTLSVILGHSDVRITLNRYVHPTMDSRREQMNRLPDFYGHIRGQTA